METSKEIIDQQRSELLKLKEFVKGQKDLPEEFAKIVNDNFWDLL